MATTKSTTKKTAARKAPAKKAATVKKSAPKKTAAKKTTVKKTAAKRTTTTTSTDSGITASAVGAATSAADAVREVVTSAVRESNDTFQQYKSVAGEQTSEVLDFVRGVVDIAVGVPFVLQARVADTASVSSVDVDTLKGLVADAKSRLASAPSVDFDAVKAFFDTAKTEGHVRIVVAQQYVGPIACAAGERLGEAADRFEQIPAQLGDLIESGRARIKSLIPA